MEQEKERWVEEFPAEIAVCDTRGILLAMNAAAEAVFAEEGGNHLLGSNILDCHPGPDRSKLERMLAIRQPNAYISKNIWNKDFHLSIPLVPGKPL